MSAVDENGARRCLSRQDFVTDERVVGGVEYRHRRRAGVADIERRAVQRHHLGLVEVRRRITGRRGASRHDRGVAVRRTDDRHRVRGAVCYIQIRISGVIHDRRRKGLCRDGPDDRSSVLLVTLVDHAHRVRTRVSDVEGPVRRIHGLSAGRGAGAGLSPGLGAVGTVGVTALRSIVARRAEDGHTIERGFIEQCVLCLLVGRAVLGFARRPAHADDFRRVVTDDVGEGVVDVVILVHLDICLGCQGQDRFDVQLRLARPAARRAVVAVVQFFSDLTAAQRDAVTRGKG